MRTFVVAVVSAVVLGATGRATPYWVSYEASGAFPEQEGWQRRAYGGGAQRSFEAGSLVLDDGGASGIIDDYYISGTSDPAPGEVFRMEWRLRVDEAEYIDPGVAISSYGHGIVDLAYTREGIRSLSEQVSIAIAPGVFHDYVLTTTDMVGYQLAIDGELAYAGRFVGPWWASGVTWGDSFYGASSVSRWDYFRFGVVPEPSAAALFGLAIVAGMRAVGMSRGALK